MMGIISAVGETVPAPLGVIEPADSVDGSSSLTALPATGTMSCIPFATVVPVVCRSSLVELESEELEPAHAQMGNKQAR